MDKIQQIRDCISWTVAEARAKRRGQKSFGTAFARNSVQPSFLASRCQTNPSPFERHRRHPENNPRSK